MPNGSSAYVNPIPNGVTPERIDQGVDFAGSGAIKAIGDAVIVMTNGGGWPGGPYMSYKLTSGPAAGKFVYVAENIRPTVHAGEQVKAGQTIATMFNGGTGIETGWAAAGGGRPESQTPEAGSISGANLPGGGSNPTAIGKNFDQLLIALGAKRAPNFGNPVGGKLPSGYPAWNKNNITGGPTSSSSSSGDTGGGITSDIFGGIAGDIFNPVLSSLGVSSLGDFFQRLGLVLVGMILILVGIWKISNKTVSGPAVFEGKTESHDDPELLDSDEDEDVIEGEIVEPPERLSAQQTRENHPSKAKAIGSDSQSIKEFGENGPKVGELEEVPF